MQLFLNSLEKYELLIELIITLLTIILSLVAIFQTQSIAKKQLKQEETIAKQQADLQERQLRVSVYEQKDKINRTLNIVFDTAARFKVLFNAIELDTLEQRKLYDLLKNFVDGIDFQEISYTLKQSRSFLSNDVYQSIRMIRIYIINRYIH